MSQHGHFMSQMTDPLGTDVATLRSVASDLCQVSKVLQDSDIALLVRLCEITKAQMQEQVAGVISSGSGGATSCSARALGQSAVHGLVPQAAVCI